jgi:hypothetical protein
MMKTLSVFPQFLLSVCIAGLGLAAVPPTSALAQNETVLVLDHSGSMWARMDGSPKISVLRNALDPLLIENEGKIDLGIIAYGTQKKNGCDGVETLRPIGAIDAKSTSKVLADTAPKGSAPVAASLNEAAGLFKAENGVRSLILVSDSTDDCEADPCAVAEELKKQSPSTVIHVLGFDEKADEDLQELSCISEATGGVFATASNGEELGASLRKLLQLAEAGMTEDAEGRAYPVSLAPPGGPDSAFGAQFSSDEPGTLVLSAMLEKDNPALSSGLVWRIFDGRVQADGNYDLLHKFDQARTVVSLKPGDYLVNAAYGRANLTKRVTVWPGKRQEDVFNLNAGGLRLYATLAEQPLISEQSLTFHVYSDESDQFGNRRKVVTGAKSGVVLRLNGGNYRVESAYGDANSVMEVDVTVEPGKLTEASIDHRAGKVTFRLVEKPGGEALADTIWRIFASDGQLVKRSGGAFPSHVLASGEYSVRVQHGELEYAARFSVAAGDKKQVEVVKP